MTGYFILFAFVVALVVALLVAFVRKNADGRRSGVHPEDEPPSPRVR